MERVESPEEPWRYGDEASLYSIAEDSREDRVSVSASGALGASFGAFDTNEASSNAPNPGVELCIAEDERTRSSSDEIFYYHQPRGSRRLEWIGIACIVCTLMGGIAVSVFFTQYNREVSQSRSSASFKAGEVKNEDDVRPGEQEVAADETEVTDSRLTMAETHVLNALNQCPGIREALLDPETPQGRIYGLLVQEVFDGAKIDNFGMVGFADLHGEEFLKERYALEMLYDSTNGENWTRKGGWEIGSTASDPCSWFGVTCESSRILGTCAVTGVDLGA